MQEWGDKFLCRIISKRMAIRWDGAAGAFSLVDTKNKISLTYFQHIHNWDIKMQTEIKNALYSCV